MSSFGDMLIYLRKKHNMSQGELAKRSGVSRSSIGMYELGAREPSFETLEAFADIFNVNMDTLLGKTDLPPGVFPFRNMSRIPLLGSIACGSPILAQENISDYVDLPGHIRADYALACKGDSMINARIYDGDIVYIRQQDTVENGEIAAVRIGDEATLKRVYYNGSRVILRACNPLYPDMEYDGEQLDGFQVLGRAVAFTSTIKRHVKDVYSGGNS